MSAAHVTLGGKAVTEARIHVPRIGPWFIDASLSDDSAIEGSATFALGETTLQGTIDPGHAGAFALQRRVRVLAGGGGWGRSVVARDYANDAGVSARVVASDIAADVGETLGSFAPEASALRAHYARSSGAAARVLEDAIGSAAWWVDYAGVTQVGSRGTRAADPAHVSLLEADLRQGWITLAIDTLDAIGIGSVVTDDRLESGVTVNALEISVTAEGLRARAWIGDGVRSSLADTMAAIVERCTDARLFGIFRYRVVTMSVDRANLQIVHAQTGLPDLAVAPIMPGIPGIRTALQPGKEVLVQFVDGDRGQPVITGFALGSGKAPLVGVGAYVQVLLPPNAAVSGTVSGNPFVGVVTFTSPAIGIVQGPGNSEALT